MCSYFVVMGGSFIQSMLHKRCVVCSLDFIKAGKKKGMLRQQISWGRMQAVRE